MKTLAVGQRSAAAHAGAVGRRRERLFYTGMAAAFVITVFAGFARTYYLRPYFGTPALTPLLHLHGIVFTSWLALLLTQTVLVAANRTGIHRRLGTAGAALAVLMVLVGTATAIIRAKIVEVPPGAPSPLVFLTIPLGDMPVFASLAGAGFYFRRRVDVHKRLMLLATISILPAATPGCPSPSSSRWGLWLSSASQTSSSWPASSTTSPRAGARTAPRSGAACSSSRRTRCGC